MPMRITATKSDLDTYMHTHTVSHRDIHTFHFINFIQGLQSKYDISLITCTCTVARHLTWENSRSNY